MSSPLGPPGSRRRIADELDYVGVLAVEMFIVGDDELLVNEIAPRPHNSGHWTLDASVTSQFEQQIRAVCGVGLGDTAMTAPAVAMVNLLGDLWFTADAAEPVEPNWAAALAEPAATLHLYGKTEPRRGRKMGHLTVTAATADAAESLARSLRADSESAPRRIAVNEWTRPECTELGSRRPRSLRRAERGRPLDTSGPVGVVPTPVRDRRRLRAHRRANMAPAISFTSFAPTMAVMSRRSRVGLSSTTSAPTSGPGSASITSSTSRTVSPPGSW